jgi:hypothetical protein
MSAAFPITKDRAERVEWRYETVAEGDIGLIKGAGIVLARTQDGALWQDSGRCPWPTMISSGICRLCCFLWPYPCYHE